MCVIAESPKMQNWGILQIHQAHSTYSAMVSQEMYDVSDRPRYTLKKNPFVSLLDDPLGAFLQVPKNVLHIEDIFRNGKTRSV